MELKLDSVTDFLNEQEWYKQLKGKWEELDPQSRLYLKVAGAVGALLLLLALVISSMMSVHGQEAELMRKKQLLTLIQSANEEIHNLRASGVPAEISGQSGPWKPYFESMAGNAGIDKDNLSISAEKEGSGGNMAKESLYELSLKKSTIRQAVKYAYFLENGQRAVKVRHFSIDTHADPTGYIDATLDVSAFTPTEPGRGGR